ncbi:MAG: DUF4418 family protein [Ruminococcus sp.]|nr:DUF4418 family protein [Ruminococcus sp.]
MIKNYSGIFTILTCIFLLISVNTFCRPCHGMMSMPCEHSTGIACIILAVMTAVNLGGLFLKKKAVPVICRILNIIGSIGLILTPVFGKCQVASMSCNTRTFPILKIGGLLIIAVMLILTVTELIRNSAKGETHHVHSQ